MPALAGNGLAIAHAFPIVAAILGARGHRTVATRMGAFVFLFGHAPPPDLVLYHSRKREAIGRTGLSGLY